MIIVDNVSYKYTQNGPFKNDALSGIDLQIKQGEFCGIIGHTGSGKSTLIQLFNGLLKPTAGKILVDGVDTSDKTQLRQLRFKVGLIMQYPEYQLFEETVEKDIAFGAINMGLDKSEVKIRVEEALSIVGMDKKYLSCSPFELSGGQKRRVAIAGVLVMKPKILVLDEPTSGLDSAGRDEILHRIKEFKDSGTTVILVSHRMEDVALLSDTIVVMNHGTIAMTGAPKEVFNNAEYLENIGLSIPDITSISRLLKQRGIPIDDNVYETKQIAGQIAQAIRQKDLERS